MKLKSIQIENFKSIKKLDFNLEDNYHVLAGKNESGKTNILEAISFLNPDKEINSSYVREPLPDDDTVESSQIGFIYTVENSNERDQLFKALKSLFFQYDSVKNFEIGINNEGERFDIEDLFKSCIDCKISIDFINSTRVYNCYTLNFIKLIKGWKKFSRYCPEDRILENKNGIKTLIGDSKFIYADLYPELFDEYVDIDEYVEDVEIEEIIECVVEKVKDLLESQEKNCIHWYYDSKNLLPSKVVLNEFKDAPESCLPLMYLFNLAGYNDVTTELNRAIERGGKALPNLLRRVSAHSTTFFNNKWKEYDNIEFDLTKDGNYIEIGIKEQNSYNLSQRSDGFKRFITFLIMISAQVETNQLKDSVILIDEPEISLHPSGQKYLRKELKKISENNKVIFSTHSIFLIDSDNLENHYAVKKEDEETKVTRVETSTILDEEVIYNAMGYSVFENLKQKNVLFEGWRDKHLFRTALSHIPSDYSDVHKLKDYGLTHSNGVKDIKYITPILELACRDCLVTSDSDQAAKEKQKIYNKERQSYKWLRYDELLKGSVAVTAEDFIKSEALLAVLKKFSEKYSLTDLTEEQLADERGKMHVVEQWLKPVSSGKDFKKDTNAIKEELFNNLKYSQIEPKYYDLLNQIYVETNKE